jgi:diguanylate cyclase (GGDEF)-like protein
MSEPGLWRHRLDPLKRWREERDVENRTDSAAAVASGTRLEEGAAAVDEGFRRAGEPQRDPFFKAPERPYTTELPAAREGEFQDWVHQNRVTDLDHPKSFYDYRGAFLEGAAPDVRGHWPDRFKQPGHPTFTTYSRDSKYAPPVRRLGPTPREGMRPSRLAPSPDDPYASESQLARTLTQIRYQSPLTPFLGLGQTEAKILRTGEGLLGKIPVIGAPFRALEQDLDERINRDEQTEQTVRERYMGTGERIAQDLARFGVEFEAGGALAPILKAAPLVRALPEGAGFLAREGAAATRLARGAATEAAQFGAFEGGKSILSGESIDETSRHMAEGELAGAVFGTALPAAGSVVGGLVRPLAEGIEAIPGAIHETVRRGAQDALVADAMIREGAGKIGERLRGATGRIRRGIAERVSPELKREATTDPLTGALNRRADDAASEAIVTKREPGTRIIRLRADLDNFKALNDARGHEAGDQALQRVTEAFKQAAREGDIIDTPGAARVGGDEFGATLRIGEHADPEAIARRFEAKANEALAEAGLHQAGEKQVGVSVGWAEHGAGGAKELDAAADAAAAARKKGRGVSRPRETVEGIPERRAGERRAVGSAAEQMADVRRRAATERVDPSSLSDDEALFAAHGDDFSPSTEPSVVLRVGGRVFTGKNFQEAATRAVKKTRGRFVQDWEYDAIQGDRYPPRRSGDPAWTAEVEHGYETVHGEFVSEAEKAAAAQKARETLSARPVPRPERRAGERRTLSEAPAGAPEGAISEAAARAQERQVASGVTGGQVPQPVAGRYMAVVERLQKVDEADLPRVLQDAGELRDELAWAALDAEATVQRRLSEGIEPTTGGITRPQAVAAEARAAITALEEAMAARSRRGAPEALPRAPDARPAEQGARAAPGAQEPPIVPSGAPQEAVPPKPKGRGKKATPEQLETAFQQGRRTGGNAVSGLLGVQRAAAASGLQTSASDVAALGAKATKGQLRENALSLEIRERFERSLATSGKTPQTLADAVRAMDEQLTSSEHRHYDVSRYGEGDVTDARLPEHFYEANWKGDEVPTPGDLRSLTGFGNPVDQTLRRLETASARAARDADIVEHLGAGKDAPGVKRARQVATDLANQKVALEQQAERAIARSEEIHSEGARGKAAALNRDLTQAKVKPSDWEGNKMAEGEIISDGKIMFRRADLEGIPASRRTLYDKRPKIWSAESTGIPQESAEKLFASEVERGTTKLELLGHLPMGEGEKYANAFLVPEGQTTGLRRVNAPLLRRLQEITKFDELRGPKETERAITAYRDGEPVGLIMPIRMLDAPPFSVAEARELAGKPIEPPKRPSGTTKIAGLTVREPLTARTPMEPNFEQPLASASLPATGVHQMTTPATKGPDVAAVRARIVRKMADILDIPVRIGKYGGFKRGTLGIYKVKPEAIRLKVAKDVEVLGHEVGHHIHNLFFGTAERGGLSSQVLRPWVKELKPLGKGISDQSSAEGLAEFFRRFLTNPAEAKSAAPKFFEYVEGRLAREFPEVRTMFEDARAAYKTYLEAGPEARVASNISLQPEKHWSFGDKFRRFMTGVLDDMYDVEKAQHEIISSALGLDAPPLWRPFARVKWMAEVTRQTKWEENAADLAHLVRGSAGTAEHFVKRGTLDYKTLQVKGKSLEAVLRPVSKQFDEFLHYAVSRRVMELKGRGVETGIRPEDASAVVEKYIGREHFTRAFSDLQTYQQHLLEYLRDARVISPDSFEKITAQNEHYLPFYRVLDDEAARRASGGSVFGQVFSPVKRIKGSGRDIINPFESIIKNTYLYTRLAARQRVSEALAKLSLRDGAGVWIERIPAPTKVTKLSFGEIENQVGKILGDRMDLEGMTEPQRQQLAEEMLAVYRPGDYFGKDNIISVLQGDKRLWYEVDPDLYKAMMGLSHEQAGSLTRLLTFPAKALRIGATLSLEFIGRNPIRDQLAAFVQSEYGFKPGFDWGRGLFHMLKRDDLFWKWKAAGGERAALLELDRDSLRKSVRDVLGAPPGAGEILKDVIKSPIELLKLLSAATEDATRIGEFARGVEREGTSRAGLEKAAASSREVSVDFARHGAKTEAIRMMTAFWNARLQGYYRLARSMRDHPVRTTARAGVAITLPSTLLFYANKDDPEYWAKPQWERDLFWHVKLRGTYYKIPKPFELGIIFGTIPEHILEWAHTHDPKGLEQALTQTVGSDVSSLVPIPTTLVPLIENFANWSMFRRQPIVSRTLEDVQPQYQFTEGTSEVAKGLGRMLGQSPQKIDNLMFGWTGGLGRMAVDLGDVGGQQVGLLPNEPRPSKTAADIPGVRGFVSKPAGRGSEDVERFYSAWSQAQEAKSTRDLLNREDRLDELDTFEDKNADLLDRYDDFKGYADELASLRHEIAEVSRDESLTPDARRQEVDRLGREMQQVAREAIQRKTPATVAP